MKIVYCSATQMRRRWIVIPLFIFIPPLNSSHPLFLLCLAKEEPLSCFVSPIRVRIVARCDTHGLFGCETRKKNGLIFGGSRYHQRHTTFIEMGRVIRGRDLSVCSGRGEEEDDHNSTSFPILVARVLTALYRSEKGC